MTTRAITLTLAAGLVVLLSAAKAVAGVETVTVTASALPGVEADTSTLPVHLQTLTVDDLSRFGAPDLRGAMERNLTGVSFADAQDNAYQGNLFYRGFEASALIGDPVGIAVYVDAVRFNQAFGDTVEWSLIPEAAVASAALEGADPVYGLNALGGAVTLSMKDGFGADGLTAEAEGGSYGHGHGSISWGASDGDRAVFVAADVFHDDGWRQFSPSTLGRAYANLAWHGSDADLHLDLMGATTDLTGNGTSPVELLMVKRSAVFTHPDNARDTFGLANLYGNWRPDRRLTLSGNLYLSLLGRRSKNGDASDAAPCDDGSGFLCLDDRSLLTDRRGQPIPDFLEGGPYAQLNATRTSTLGVGGTVQAAWRGGRFQLLAGVAIDHGHTGFSAESAVGALTPTRGFGGPGIVIDQADRSIAPVRVTAENTYYGLYAQAGMDVTAKLRLDVGGRYNIAEVSLHDRLGGALNGSHSFSRFNPTAGLSYRVAPNIAAHFDYAEANRAPTPAEFSCADPAAPCSLTNFFVGDPDLKQVTARTYELGLRGGGDAFRWQVDAYRTDTDNDILFTASGIRGRAFFRNIGATRHEGIEANAAWRAGPLSLVAAYSYTHAVFETAVTLLSPDNPAADGEGRIFVRPGNRLPSIPEHIAKLSADYALGDRWHVLLSARYASGVYLAGDDANLTPPTADYIVLDLGGRVRVLGDLDAYATIENLFDRRYETFGTFSPTSDVVLKEAPGASNPRSLSPAQPRTLLVGLRFQN